MAASSSSSSDSSAIRIPIPIPIPLEWVDDSEFQAIENALAFATSACKRPKTSSSSAVSDVNNDDSAGRRLPVWAEKSTITAHYTNYQNKVSSNINADNEAAHCHSFETSQLTGLNPCSWLSYRPPYTATPKLIVPKMNFGGRIVYSRTHSEVEKASMELFQLVNSKKSNMEGRVPMGLDLEWKPFYNKVGEIPRKVAVVQICLDADRCDVMHIIHSGIPPVLQSLLEDGSSVKVGVCIDGDALKMRKDYDVHVREVEDLSTIACQKLIPPRRWSLSSLCEMLTGKEVDKPRNIRCGNWEVEILSTPQLRYAATDAYASWYLYEVLKSLPDLPVVNSREVEENH